MKTIIFFVIVFVFICFLIANYFIHDVNEESSVTQGFIFLNVDDIELQEKKIELQILYSEKINQLVKEEIKLNSKSQSLDSKYIQNELDMIKNEIKLFENKINELFSNEESINSLQKELTLFNLKIPLLYLLGIPITSSGIGGTHNGIIIELDETKVVSQEQFERYVYVISYFVPSKIPTQIILSEPPELQNKK